MIQGLPHLTFIVRNLRKMSRIIRAVALLFPLTAISDVFACTQIPTPPASSIFDEASEVFKGVAVSVELMDFRAGDERPMGLPEEIPFIRVRWRVEEIYKGKHIENSSAMTQYFCGGVTIVVGQPYVFSVLPFDEMDNTAVAAYPDLIGSLYDFGTKGAWEDPERYQELVREFKKLRDGK